MSTDFEACVRRIEAEILPLVQQASFPPRLAEGNDILQGSLDLVLYRNLCFALDFCFGTTSHSHSLTDTQILDLSRLTRTKVIPAYLSFFQAHFLTTEGREKCALFFVRQENNSSWAKLIWNKIKQIYTNTPKSSEHELGVQMPGDLLDALARLMDIFLPKDIASFEALSFDLRRDDPSVLEAILQGGLVNRRDPLAAKNAFYILNRLVSFSKMAGGGEVHLFGSSLTAWEQFIVCYAAVQESQVHLVQPLLPVLRTILMSSSAGAFGWWRVLICKGLGNDSIPIRRLILQTVLSLDAREVPALCCPDGLDFCLDDLLRLGVDPNSSFFVSPQPGSVDLGEGLTGFFSRLIEAYARISQGHGRAMVNELLAAVEETLRVPVGLIYVLKAFLGSAESHSAHLKAFPALGNASLQCISRIAALPSLHNQRARLLVKWQLCEVLMAFADAAAISFDQLCGVLHDLVGESVALRTLGAESENFSKIANWMNSCFGSDFIRENMMIALQQFFASASTDSDADIRALKAKAQVLAIVCVFCLGTPDGPFVSYSRLIFEQLALVSTLNDADASAEDDDDGASSIPAFVMFLALNEAVKAVLRGKNDLITQLGTSKRIFDWLHFLEDRLFSAKQTDLSACQVLLEALSLLIDRASDNDERQLMQFLDMLAFRLVGYLDEKSSLSKPSADDCSDEVGFTGLLTFYSALNGLSAALQKLTGLGHVRLSLLSGDQVQRIIRFKLERPGGLNESQWDLWPVFVTDFTEAKWKCIEAMARTMTTGRSGQDSSGDDDLSLLGILACCIQALEVSKYGGTLAILKCTGTLIDLILAGPDVETAFDALFEKESEIMMMVLKSQAETQRWFDLYAEAFIKVAFRSSVLVASCSRPDLLRVLQELFDFFCEVVGPKRRGIVALMSSKLGAFFLGKQKIGVASLRDHWRSQLLRLLLYGPIRSSVDESVAARITHEHVPDSDYQVRVHAITVLNHLPAEEAPLLKDLLMDLIGRQEALSRAAGRRKMFPGDANHRLKLRAWAAILLMIGILLKFDGVDLNAARELIEMLWRFIGEETMDSTRVFMEWSLGLVYLKFPSDLIFSDLIGQRLGSLEGFSCQIVSVLSVALLIGKSIASGRHLHESIQPSLFFSQMIDHVLPLLAHNNHFVRMRAIHAFSTLYRQHPSTEDVLGYKLLAGYIGNTEHCKKFIQKCQDDLVTSPDGLQPIEDFNLDYIFGRMMSNGGVDGEAIEYYSFMNYHEPAGSVPFVNEAQKSAKPRPSAFSTTAKEEGDGIDLDGLFKDFQQKIDIYSPFSDGEESASAAGRDKLKTEIIVIASLLEKLPNLAGLARSCEIFGVKTLLVPASADLSSPDFVNVAMTADKWLDLMPMAIEAIPGFVESLKAEGFRIVALEQTANSVPLQNYSFAPKTCLILGNERTGVPAEVLHSVDDCVEIPQFGRVRSLNVHVSGSIALWKTREQDLE